MLVRSPRNCNFITQKARQGLDVSTIYARILERMVWDGPVPDVADILKLLLERSVNERDQLPSLRSGLGGSAKGQAPLNPPASPVLRDD